ncbi:MAG: HalOD1 output domain-containing protein [Haloarculaceae archaeon]
MTSTSSVFELGSKTYHKDTATHRFEYDQDETPPSMAVVTALSSVIGRGLTELEPLQTSVDAESLDSLLQVRNWTSGDVTIAGYTVTIQSYGVITVAPAAHDQNEDSDPA